MCHPILCAHAQVLHVTGRGQEGVLIVGTSVLITVALQSFPSKTRRVYKALLNLLGVITFDVHLTEASWLRLLFANHSDFLWGNLGQGA